MAVYKVIQDVEAEDKLIGFLSLKQFIFTIMAALLLFISFQVARISPFLVILTLPPALLFGLLGLYQRKDQPVEVYFMALIRFYLKPHRRIWNQDGVIETVRVTAPKKIEKHFTDGLSRTEVRSSLDKLSNLMDSRGWAAKDATFQTNIVVPNNSQQSDRLISASQFLADQPSEIHPSDDILDVSGSQIAQNFDEMMKKAAQAHKQEVVANMQKAEQQAQEQATQEQKQTHDSPGYDPYPSQMRQRVINPVGNSSRSKMRTVQMRSQNVAKDSTSTMTRPTPDAILDLAKREDRLSVETIAKEAARIDTLDDEQTISLR